MNHPQPLPAQPDPPAPPMTPELAAYMVRALLCWLEEWAAEQPADDRAA